MESNQYFDSKTGNVIEVDLAKQMGNLIPDLRHTLDQENKKDLEGIIETYSKEHYPDGLCAVYLNGAIATVVCVSSKYSPRNYWNGKWNTTIEINLESKECKGKTTVLVHYFEEGNVQLSVSKDLSVTFNSLKDLSKELQSFENEMQNGINQIYEELNESTFKSLRRQLPVTKSKMEWNKVFAYRIGSDISK